MFTDTHAHLYFDAFDADRGEVLSRAFSQGVERIISVSIDLETLEQSLALAQQHKQIYTTVGFHPTDAGKCSSGDVQTLRHKADNPRVVAVGEVGLDYYWDTTPKDVQHEVFRKMIRLADELSLPLIIHNREAGGDILRILREEMSEGQSGVFHCFTGDEAFLEEVLGLGFMVSFTGIITFKKNNLNGVVPRVPLERLLLETDAPFLAPMPFRGKRNEPAYVKHTAEKVAELFGQELEEIARVTTRNANRLFGFR